MKKKYIFLGLACVLGALFLGGVLSAGARSQWFGLEQMKQEAETVLPREDVAYRYVYEWDPEETPVKGLDVSWINGSVTVSCWDGATVRITESCAGPDLHSEDKLKLSSSGGVLKIGWNKRLVSLAVLENRRKDLEIQVPQTLRGQLFKLIRCENTSGEITLEEAFAAEKLVLASSSGRIRVMEGFTGSSADISTTSGEIQLWNVDLAEELKVRSVEGNANALDCACGKATFKNSSGWVHFSGMVHPGEEAEGIAADTVTGKVLLELSEMPGETEVRSVSGEVELTLPREAGFILDYETVSGKLRDRVGLAPGTGEHRFICGSGEAAMSVATTSGGLTLQHVLAED